MVAKIKADGTVFSKPRQDFTAVTPQNTTVGFDFSRNLLSIVKLLFIPYLELSSRQTLQAC
jgi:hypothetical protein